MKTRTTRLIVVEMNILISILLFIPVKVLYLSNIASFLRVVLMKKFIKDTRNPSPIVRNVLPI